MGHHKAKRCRQIFPDDDATDQEFGYYVAYHRKKKNKSLTHMCRYTQIHPGRYKTIENGKVRKGVTEAECVRIAMVLDLKESDVIAIASGERCFSWH